MHTIIPAPLRVVPESGRVRIGHGVRVEYAEPLLAPLIEHFCSDLERRTDIALEPALVARASALRSPTIAVELATDEELDALPKPIGIAPNEATIDERYSLSIGREKITLRAPALTGAARGLTTLTQSLATIPSAAAELDGTVSLPCVKIIDAPRFAWRGLSLDLARTFFTVEEVKRVIDLLALYKLNVLHLHLTDDQSWRIAPGGPHDKKDRGEEFYSNAELCELVMHAEERFVTVVPEIDMPGHAVSLLALHPELSTGRNELELELAHGQKYSCAWLDPELPATFEVLEDALSELASIFPSAFVDIGGDEPFGMPDELFVEFSQHIRAYLRSIGKRTIGAQESLPGADPEHIVQYWLNRVFFDVPYAEPSIDPTQEETRRRVGVHFYSPKTIEETFEWDPPENVPGVGAAVWAETTHDFSDLTFLLLPRLAGIAEKAWSDPRAAAWGEHRERLAAHGQLWNQDDLTYFQSSMVEWRRAA